MADNTKEVARALTDSPQPAVDDTRRRTRSQTRNGGIMTPPAPAQEARCKKRASQSQPTSGNKRGRKPKVAEADKKQPDEEKVEDVNMSDAQEEVSDSKKSPEKTALAGDAPPKQETKPADNKKSTTTTTTTSKTTDKVQTEPASTKEQTQADDQPAAKKEEVDKKEPELAKSEPVEDVKISAAQEVKDTKKSPKKGVANQETSRKDETKPVDTKTPTTTTTTTDNVQKEPATAKEPVQAAASAKASAKTPALKEDGDKKDEKKKEQVVASSEATAGKQQDNKELHSKQAQNQDLSTD